MKLAAIYNVFDSEELLEGSIKQIYEHVDRVIILYQTQSNWGEKYDYCEWVVQDLANRYDKIYLHKYTPDFCFKYPIIGHSNEKQKRLLGTIIANNLECDYFLFMDCDEYYDSEQFAAAKQEIINKGYDATACPLYTYWKEPVYQLDPIEPYYVPFICKNKEDIEVGEYMPVKCDPTRGVRPINNFHLFDIDKLAMHHYSWVRRDISRKIRNSSAKMNLENISHNLQTFEDWKEGDTMLPYIGYSTKKVENTFGITI